MIVYCSWDKQIPFEVKDTMLVYDMFAMMAKKVAPGVTPAKYCIVRSNSIKTPLLLNKTLAELKVAPKTQFVCKDFDYSSIIISPKSQ